jgi:short-subunit dehydrogenase
VKPADARVVLTGASGGIGKALASALVEAGAAVLLVGRSPAALAALCQSLQRGADPARVQWREADLDELASIVRLGRDAADWQCNVVVHGAGLASFGRFESAHPEDMHHLLRVNLLAPMALTQALLPHLRRQRRAQVICIGSVLGALGLPGYSVYGASKAGLRGFAQALRRELADGPVRVQYLGPRSTRTAFNSAPAQAYAEAMRTASDPPQVVAQALLEMLLDETAERFLGYPEKVAVRINGLAPTLLDGAFDTHRKHLPPADAASVSPFAPTRVAALAATPASTSVTPSTAPTTAPRA